MDMVPITAFVWQTNHNNLNLSSNGVQKKKKKKKQEQHKKEKEVIWGKKTVFNNSGFFNWALRMENRFFLI